MRKFITSIRNFWEYSKHRPTVLVNIAGLLIIVFCLIGWTIYQQVRPIDVLSGWKISLEPTRTREIDGKVVAVYRPNESLIFTSTSIKLTDAAGTTSRSIICDATELQPAREIQLDTLPATKPAGVNAGAQNAITLPDVTQYNNLPRYCFLEINVVYQNVNGTGRNWTESARTESFLVEAAALDIVELEAKIKELSAQITDLQQQLDEARSATGTQQRSTTTTPTQPQANTQSTSTPTTPTTPTQPTQPQDDSVLHQIPIIGDLFKAIGL